MRSLIYVFIFSIFITSCQKKETLTYVEKSNLGVNDGEIVSILKNSQQLSIAKIKDEEIQFLNQTVNGIPVRNSFVKFQRKKDQILNFKAKTAKVGSFSRRDKLTLPPFEKLLSQLTKLDSSYEKCEIISTEFMYEYINTSLELRIVVKGFNRRGEPFEATYDADGKFLEIKRVGSSFTDVTTVLFTLGPKLSQLSELTLKAVSSSPSMSNNFVSVTSESDKKISALQSILKFDTKDDRFDQMQVYYYLNKSLKWMADNLKVQAPTKLDAVVHVGFPEKTNSAFYFQGRIRLGKGDDEIYSYLAQDASIVFHESFHGLVESLARLPYEGEGGSLNEAFADFFTCVMLGRPYLGESSYLKADFKRSLLTHYRWSDRNGGLYHDSLIASGLLWTLKEKLGTENTIRLAAETLAQLSPVSDFKDFSQRLIQVSKKILITEQYSVVQSEISERGLVF